jgi:hypothetical protein
MGFESPKGATKALVAADNLLITYVGEVNISHRGHREHRENGIKRF